MSLSLVELSSELSRIVEEVGRSVVRVEMGRRAASGLAISAHEVVTVAHVVESEQGSVAGFKSKLKGRDRGTDLALLEVEGELTPVELDDAAQLKVGQLVLALGRPGETVRATSGIISVLSAAKFQLPQGGELSRFLEADAGHQPGFSGGPLVSAQGRVLGINTTRLVRHTRATLLAADVKKVLEQLRAHGKVRRSYLGLTLQPVVLPESVRAATGDEIGLLVMGVDDQGPGHKAGIGFGETVLHLGDDSVRTVDDVWAYLRSDRVGQSIPVKVFRQGKVETVTLTLAARP